ncbi:MAG TPA: putative lipid II flippase FtsW [Candidatus Methylacidiphilales bacterium]|jgi:cell division protein FtsW|nr:putative lipid II flippase FtsW [Candidatus Methylacidiphilales bacterium]
MQRNVAYLLLIVMLGLIALGLVMLSSTSAVLAPNANDMNGVYSNLRKQFAWLIIGGIVCVFLSRYDYQKLLCLAPWMTALACAMLVLCLVPHIGVRINGSPRWLRVAGWTYQPSEFAKLALILFLSWWMGKNQRHAGEFMRGLFWPVACMLPLLLLMVRQQDYGTTAIMLAIFIVLMFVAGTRMIYLAPLPVIGFTGLIGYAISTPERWARIEAFMHPDHMAAGGKGWQQLQALIALGSGGLWGLGLGNSRQKMYWLPEVNTDFVFPIIGEELGMWVCLAVVLAFLVLVLCSGWITIHAPDPAGVLLGTGLTVMIALQALMNLAVVTSLMPTKGIPLPFISYGGSNLLTCLAAVGILFNMHRQGIYQAQNAPVMKPKSYSVRM